MRLPQKFTIITKTGKMANCDWCGKYFRDGNGYTSGPRWNKRYYCSKKCALEGENSLTDDDLAEDNLSFAQRTGRFVKKAIISIIIILTIFIIIGLLS